MLGSCSCMRGIRKKEGFQRVAGSEVLTTFNSFQLIQEEASYETTEKCEEPYISYQHGT